MHGRTEVSISILGAIESIKADRQRSLRPQPETFSKSFCCRIHIFSRNHILGGPFAGINSHVKSVKQTPNHFALENKETKTMKKLILAIALICTAALAASNSGIAGSTKPCDKPSCERTVPCTTPDCDRTVPCDEPDCDNRTTPCDTPDDCDRTVPCNNPDCN